jgi:hypothetical protein
MDFFGFVVTVVDGEGGGPCLSRIFQVIEELLDGVISEGS